MTKAQFLEQLRQELCFLPQEEREEAISYYDEYFSDAGIPEEEVCQKLGSPKEVADEFRREFHAGETKPSGKDLIVKGAERRPFPIWLAVVLLVVTAPIWISILSTIGGVLLGAVCGVGALVVAGVAVLIAGGACIVAGAMSFHNPLRVMLLIGGGLFLIGLGILMTWGMIRLCIWLVPKCIQAVAAVGRRILKALGGQKG